MKGRIQLPSSTRHPFDLAMVLDGTQDFRWKKLDNQWYSGVLAGNIVHLRQCGDILEYRAHANLDFLLTSYFRLDQDIDAVYSDLSSGDPYIAYLTRAYPHLRLLRQPDPWECTVAYICSANNSVERISEIVEAIARAIGEKTELAGNIRYKFPSPERVLEAGVEPLRDLRLGLDRHNKIIEAARRVCEGKLDLQRLSHPDTSYAEARRHLMDCYGIGAKIADCIALFSLNKLQAFPIDRHIEKALVTHYFPPGSSKPKSLPKWVQDYFGEYAGCAAQLLFQSQREPSEPKHMRPHPVPKKVTLSAKAPPQIRLHIETRTLFAEGIAFGNVGPYEKLVGRVDFAVHPDSPAFSSVVDIKHAQRNADGLVEYSTDFFMLKPANMARGNRRLVYDVNNGGTKLLVHFLNDAPQVDDPTTVEDAGNGFLMRRGYTVLWSGWQGDILPGDNRMAMRLPMASMDGTPITGPVRTEFSPRRRSDQAGISFENPHHASQRQRLHRRLYPSLPGYQRRRLHLPQL